MKSSNILMCSMRDPFDDKLYKYNKSRRFRAGKLVRKYLKQNLLSVILLLLLISSTYFWIDSLARAFQNSSVKVVSVQNANKTEYGYVSKQHYDRILSEDLEWLVEAANRKNRLLTGLDVLDIMHSLYEYGTKEAGHNIMRVEQARERYETLKASVPPHAARNHSLTSFNSSVLAFNLPKNKPLFSNRHTLFLITPTYPNKKNGGNRTPYFERHLASLYLGMAESVNIYKPHPFAKDAFQIVWLISEDGPELDGNLVNTLNCGEIPYIYFSYGPYHNYGNPQRNAALSVVRMLHDAPTNFESGVAYFVDDDSLLTTTIWPFLTRVKGVSIWPSGNLGKDGWERPVFNHTTNRVETILGNGQYRKFPLDMGAFAFDTLLLKQKFSKHQYFVHHGSGGESPFLAQACESWDDLNVLCTGCKLYFHNAKLRPYDSRLQCIKSASALIQ